MSMENGMRIEYFYFVPWIVFIRAVIASYLLILSVSMPCYMNAQTHTECAPYISSFPYPFPLFLNLCTSDAGLFSVNFWYKSGILQLIETDFSHYVVMELHKPEESFDIYYILRRKYGAHFNTDKLQKLKSNLQLYSHTASIFIDILILWFSGWAPISKIFVQNDE